MYIQTMLTPEWLFWCLRTD